VAACFAVAAQSGGARIAADRGGHFGFLAIDPTIDFYRG